MGNSNSQIPQVPPGGAVIVLQSPEDCCIGKPAFDGKKPSALRVTDDVWNDFSAKVSAAVAKYIDQRLPMLFFLLMFVVSFAFQLTGGLRELMGGGMTFLMGIPLLFFGITAGSQWFIITKNQGVDSEISAICQQLSSASGGQVTAHMENAWTGLCKPKHARTMRTIVIQASSGVMQFGQPQSGTCQVQIPPGVVAGQTVQANTPNGMVSFTVPPGVQPGQMITVQMPVPVVQATVVQEAPAQATIVEQPAGASAV
mmetsp:Transcript_48448/g.87379  ORF Transcript_48448/g.87379 Transcript_48448/m.87379 type:complete len:256 (-) Transcript_48448:220-987(-)